MVNISIVVPVYNAEETIDRCVRSILASDAYTSGAAEVVLINDGSSDRSGSICSDYARRHDRVTAIDTENGGVSAARNRGIAEATGAFIAFVDSDDYVAPDYHAAAFYPIATDDGVDLVITGFTKVAAGGDLRITSPDAEMIDKANFPRRLVDIANRGLLNSVSNKVYRRNIIDLHKIRFEVGRKSAEDLLFNLDYAAVSCSTVIVSTTGAHFVADQSSATHQLARRYDAIHELENSVAYRQSLNSRLTALGVPRADIEAYFRAKSQVWFQIMVRNIQAAGTPYSVREQIQQVRRIMNFLPAREDVLNGRSRSRLASMNRLLYRINSAHLAWAACRVT
ncbi:glycosyltransferase family 2 protein [Microbacterium profundi]